MKTKLSAEQVRSNNTLMDSLLVVLGLKNDAALSRVLEVAPPVISKIRHGRLDIGDTLLICAHEVSGVSIRVMKEAIGQKCLDRVTA